MSRMGRTLAGFLQCSSQQKSSEFDAPSVVDPLEITAQDYPWLYMNSTLDACFEESEQVSSSMTTLS